MLSITVQERPTFFQVFFFYIQVSFWNETLHICNDCEEVQTFVRETDVRNLRQGKRRSLRHLNNHQTGKTPTHNRAEKALRSSPSLPKWQLVCNLRHPTPSLHLHPAAQSHFSTRIHEWTSGRFSFPSDLLRWAIHLQSAVMSTFRVTFYLFFVAPPTES